MEGGEETRQWMQVLPWRRSNMAPSWMVRAVVLAHSERCHSDLAAPQPHPKRLLPFRTSLPSFAARLRVNIPFLVHKPFAKASSGTRTELS
jgi:hypothetical protein